MCGIAGIIRIDRRLNNEPSQLLKSIEHRGPDGGNYFLDDQNNLALVHTRLSIIDPEGGSQPMCNDAKSMYITYNGELYNFRELRNELIENGFRFKTSSDTEVILAAYQCWGRSCLKRFRGMFSFCIIDYGKREFLLARDPFGMKPVYYYLDNNTFVFSSELSGIRSLELNFSYDLKAIDSYLSLQYIPGIDTAYNQVKKIAPAHSIVVSFDLKTISDEPHWEFSYADNVQLHSQEWLERLEVTIEQSVRAHLVSDVPFGAFLSGGIDSTLVVTYMSKILKQRVKTFTIGFKDDRFSETKYADEVAKKLGTEHYTEIIEPDALAILPLLVKHYGEPFGDSSAIPTFYVSKLAREHVPMVLSGDGGDEAFFGYQSYTRWNDSIAYKGVAPYKKIFHPLLEKIYPVRYPPRNNYLGWIEISRYLPYAWRKRLWGESKIGEASLTRPEFDRVFKSIETENPMRRAQYSDLKTYLPCDILTKVDRASMLHGLEVRTPLVDIEIWKLVSQMPVGLNLDLTTGSGKNLLKDILRKHYPENFVSRPKQGFSIPIDEWMATPRMVERMSLLTGTNSLLREFFDLKSVQNLVSTGSGRWLWLLLVLDEWLATCEGKRR